jgi:alginate O-acetyltransferase complex protein AlgJ
VLTALICLTSAAQASDLAFDRTSSQVTVRAISETTRAALDFAAWDRNPVFHWPMKATLTAPAQSPALAELTFGGTLATGTVCNHADQMPLSDDERATPLSWTPLLKLLAEWNYDAAQPLMVLGSLVSGEKWGNDEDELVQPLQQIATAWLHGDEIWVKVEFRPELTWLPADDEDADHYPEVYGRLGITAQAAEIAAHIRGDYLTRTLAPDEVETFFFEVASDWYQQYMTYALEPDTTRPWPNADTEPEIVAILEGKSFASPLMVLKSIPYGQPVYNVFVMAAGEPDLTAFQADVRRQLDTRPEALKGLIGNDGFLFFRGDLEYLLSGELRDQPDERDPYPAIVDFKSQLAARGIDFLLVVIPTKAEVYPEKLSTDAPPMPAVVAPWCAKLVSELQAAGVESVDLLPTFMAQRGAVDGALLYMPQDTHWTPRGAELAAALIGERVRQYPWYEATRGAGVQYSTRETTFTRMGDICGMLTDQERLPFRPLQLTARQVVAPDGMLYVDDPASPIVMLGDSFTGVFHFEDCKHAGVSAHLARELSMPVDLIMAQGSGPRIRGQLARRGHDAIASKKLVIWTVVARDLYNYWAPWQIIPLP